jgi:hypothetical protein
LRNVALYQDLRYSSRADVGFLRQTTSCPLSDFQCVNLFPEWRLRQTSWPATALRHIPCFSRKSNPHHLEPPPMTQASRIANPAADELPQDLIDLNAALERLPAEQRELIQPLMNRVIDSTRRRRRILHLVQDALSQLRLDMKYLLFDLEATRRERDDYRRRCEQG